MQDMRRKHGFTLVELLATVAVLAILVAIMAPRWYAATDRSRLVGCKQNLHNYATALQVYSSVHDNRYPTSLEELPPDFLRVMAPCPAAAADTYTAGYTVREDRASYTLACSGQNHKAMRMEPNEPYYNPEEGLAP